MFHDQHVLTNGMHLPIFLCSAQGLMGISGMGSFPEQSGGSLIIISSSLGVVLNSFSYFSLVVGKSLPWGYLDAPHMFECPHTFGCPMMPPIVQTPLHMSPMLLCASACSEGFCM